MILLLKYQVYFKALWVYIVQNKCMLEQFKLLGAFGIFWTAASWSLLRALAVYFWLLFSGCRVAWGCFVRLLFWGMLGFWGVFLYGCELSVAN